MFSIISSVTLQETSDSFTSFDSRPISVVAVVQATLVRNDTEVERSEIGETS